MKDDARVARLDAAADTVHWGYFDAKLAPVLTIDSGDRVTISTVSGPPEILRYVVVKGPVAIDGISLTVIAKDTQSFAVSLVQYTQEHTNLHARKPGDRVNLETDLFARYVEQMVQEHFAAHAEQAASYVSTGESPRDAELNAVAHAALTAVIQGLMSFDECVTKR